MRQISLQIDDEMARQIKELAELWGLPEVRHNTPVIQKCLKRVWMMEIALPQLAEKYLETTELTEED